MYDRPGTQGVKSYWSFFTFPTAIFTFPTEACHPCRELALLTRDRHPRGPPTHALIQDTRRGPGRVRPEVEWLLHLAAAGVANVTTRVPYPGLLAYLGPRNAPPVHQYGCLIQGYGLIQDISPFLLKIFILLFVCVNEEKKHELQTVITQSILIRLT